MGQLLRENSKPAQNCWPAQNTIQIWERMRAYRAFYKK